MTELPALPSQTIALACPNSRKLWPCRPDTPHGGEDMLLSDDKDGGQDHDAHPPDVGLAAEVYLSRRNNTPSLPVFLTPCVAIQPENAAPWIVTVHTLNTRKKGEQCNELVKPITGACAVPWRLLTILEQCLRQVVWPAYIPYIFVMYFCISSVVYLHIKLLLLLYPNWPLTHVLFHHLLPYMYCSIIYSLTCTVPSSTPLPAVAV